MCRHYFTIISSSSPLKRIVQCMVQTVGEHLVLIHKPVNMKWMWMWMYVCVCVFPGSTREARMPAPVPYYVRRQSSVEWPLKEGRHSHASLSARLSRDSTRRPSHEASSRQSSTEGPPTTRKHSHECSGAAAADAISSTSPASRDSERSSRDIKISHDIIIESVSNSWMWFYIMW